MSQQFESPEAQIKHYANAVAKLVSRYFQIRFDADKKVATKVATQIVVPNRDIFVSSHDENFQNADTTAYIIKRLPYNLALEIINRQDYALRVNPKIWMLSEKQVAVIENFIAELEREVKLALALAPKKDAAPMNIDDKIQAEMKANVEATAEEAAAERPTTETGVIAPSIAEILRATNAVCELAKMSFDNPMPDETHRAQLREAYNSTPEIRRIKMIQIFNFFSNPETAEGENFYSDDYMEERYAKWNNDYRKMVEWFEAKASVIWGIDDLNFEGLPKPAEL